MNKELRSIEDDIKNLSLIDNMKDKIDSIKIIKSNIKEQQENTNKLIKELNNFEKKKSNKYKKYNIDELETLLNNTQDFKKKLKIYSHLCYKIDEITDELFGDIESSESDIEYDSN